MMSISMRILALTLVFAVALVGCRSEPTPTPVPPTEEPISQWPALSVISPVVEFRAKESDPLEVVDAGTEMTVEAGGNVVVGEAGHGVLSWEAFLTNELLAEADTLLSLSLPEEREVILDQAAGTARYVLQGLGEPANLQVKAAWTDVSVTEGVADFFLSLVAGTDPAVWLVVREGEVEITRDDESLTVTEGQAVAVSEDGPMPEVFDIDITALLAWYDNVAAGDADQNIVGVVFRCTVTADEADFLDEPDPEAESVADPLTSGTVVKVLGRDVSGEWLYVEPVGDLDRGWIAAEDVECIGPIVLVRVWGDEDASRDEPTATTAPLPTRVIYVTPTIGPTLTPTPTPTPGGDHTVKFWADDDKIDQGECTYLRWETNNISQVYYQGGGVTGQGESKECPTDDTTYRLEVILRDGSKETHEVKVKVREAKEPTDTPVPEQPTATQGPPDQPTPTEYVPPTDVPPTDVPPTDVPPTDVPPTDVPPTDVPPTTEP